MTRNAWDNWHFRTFCFNVEWERGGNCTYRCKYCSQRIHVYEAEPAIRAEGRLARHLVLAHVDLEELRVREDPF